MIIVDKLVDGLGMAFLDMIAWGLLFMAKSFMYVTLMVILVYMFAGWLKAVLGAAFAPIALVASPLDRGSLLSGAIRFIMGAIATYAFSLVIGLMSIGILNKGAQAVLNAIAKNPATTLTDTAGYSLGFSLMALLLSVLLLIVTLNARHWGAEFFGVGAFGFPGVRGAGVRLPNRGKGGGGGGGNPSGGGGGSPSGGGGPSSGGGGGGGSPRSVTPIGPRGPGLPRAPSRPGGLAWNNVIDVQAKEVRPASSLAPPGGLRLPRR